MVDLFDEIKEDMRQERYSRLWQQYGKYIIATVILALVFSGIGIWYRAYQTSQNRMQGSQLYQAMQQAYSGQTEEAITTYDALLSEDHSSLAAIARYKKAMLLIESGKLAQGSKELAVVAEDDNAPKEIQQLALLMHGYTELSYANDDAKAKAVKKLESLASEKNSVWQVSVQELLAFYYADQHDTTRAIALFDSIAANEQASSESRTRAAQMAGYIRRKD